MMRDLFLIVLVMLIGVSVAIAQEETPEPAPQSQTPGPMRTDEVVEMTQSMQAQLDTLSSNWYLTSVLNTATNTRLTWFHTCCNGVVSIEEIRFCCEDTMATYFSYDEDMLPYYRFTLANYTPFELVQTCNVNGIRINDFTGVSNGVDFLIRHFHEENGATVQNTGLYFTTQERLEQYGAAFFPDIVCVDEMLDEDIIEATEQADD
jgi:hypothetical protein